LAKEVGTKQSGISRLEREDYGRWNFATLQKVAFSLDCRLKVSLETFGSLVSEAADLSEASLRRPSIEQDPVFHGGVPWDPELAEPGPVGEMRRKLIPWLRNEGPLEKLGDWMQGFDLPLAGDDTEPSEWLLQALLPADGQLEDALAARVAEFIQKAFWTRADPGKRQVRSVRNVFALAEVLRKPVVLGQAVWTAYGQRADLPFPGSDEPGPEHPLIRALTYNQPAEEFPDLWSLWASRFLEERDKRMPDYVGAGLVGLSRLQEAPNVFGIVQGASQAKRWSLDLPKISATLGSGFSRVWAEFPDEQVLKKNVIVMAANLPDGWSVPIIKGWFESIPGGIPPELRDPIVENAEKLALTA
jgi:hypothetical protein